MSKKKIVQYEEPTDEEIDEAYGDYIGRDITNANAMVVIARELRHIRIQLANSLETSGDCPAHSNRGIADVLVDIAEAAGVDYRHDDAAVKRVDKLQS
jgi:hypothetical protein